MNPFEEIEQKPKQKSGRRKELFTIVDGIDMAPEERYINFGQLVINKPSLFKENRLAIKYRNSLGSVNKFRARKVSSKFRDLIKTIIEEQKINHKLMSELTDDEKDFFFNLIKRAKLESKLGLTGYRTKEQEEQYARFELLKGQVLAGNNNPKILKELKQLIMKFMVDGTISYQEGSMILLELLSI